MASKLENQTKSTTAKVVVKALAYIFLFFYLPLKIAGHAFYAFDPIFLHFLPDLSGPLYINDITIGHLRMTGMLVGNAFFVCLAFMAAIMTASFHALYKCEHTWCEKTKHIVSRFVVAKVVLFVVVWIAINYVGRPFFSAVCDLHYLLYLSIAGEDQVLYRAPEAWVQSVAPAISFIAMLYAFILVIIPWEKRQVIEAEIRDDPFGFDVKAINKWIGPAAQKLAENNNWTQEDILSGIKGAGGRHREDRSNVSRWYSGEKSMPTDAIVFFLMHGVQKYISTE